MYYENPSRVSHCSDSNSIRNEPKEESFTSWAVKVICSIIGVMFLITGICNLVCVLTYDAIVENAIANNTELFPLAGYISLTILFFLLSACCFYINRYIKRSER